MQALEDTGVALARAADDAAAALAEARAAVQHAAATARAHGCDLSDAELLSSTAVQERLGQLQALQVQLP